MISLVLQFTLFFLVLFVVVPGVIISLGVFRYYLHQHKHAGWHRGNPAKLTG
jgi:hypothetical protein